MDALAIITELDRLLTPILNKNIGKDFYNSVAKNDKERMDGGIGIINNCLYWQDCNNHIHYVSLEDLKLI